MPNFLLERLQVNQLNKKLIIINESEQKSVSSTFLNSVFLLRFWFLSLRVFIHFQNPSDIVKKSLVRKELDLCKQLFLTSIAHR